MPQWHRWWNLSHYQGVWEGQFLYWRSGTEWIHQWAQNNERHFMDVGTVNYDDPANPMFCKLAGAMYHCKGFTPWGTPRQGERCGDDYVEVGAHFINPDAHLFRYLLFGDRRGLELARAWADAFGRMALPPERSRECNATLGEMVSYYENTWDPQTMLYVRDLANDHNSRPWKEVPSHPGHTMYHDRWVLRYWELTRDPLLKQRILEWFEPGTNKGTAPYGYPQLRALAWQWTGKKEYLTEYLPSLSTMWDGVYVNPGDPLNYYGGRNLFFPTHSLGQMVPYYMQALLDAGIDAVPPRTFAGVPVPQVAAIRKDAVTSGWMPYGNRAYGYGPGTGYLQPKGAEPVVTLEFTGMLFNNDPMLPQNPLVSFIHIEDAEGKVLLDTTLLYGSQRPTATLTLDARKNKPPWKVFKSSYDPTLKWSGGAEGLLIGPTPESVTAAAEGRKVTMRGMPHDRSGTLQLFSQPCSLGEPLSDCGCN
jgi:hypothetical protein